MPKLATIKRLSVIILVLSLIFISYINTLGVCLTEVRWLTDEEKIRVVFDRINRMEKTSINYPLKSNHWLEVEREPYASYEDFKNKNPDCCLVGEKVITKEGVIESNSFLNSMFGRFGGYVSISYIERFRIGSRLENQKLSKYYSVSNCGVVF